MALPYSAHSSSTARHSNPPTGIARLRPWLGGLCLAASLGAHGLLLGLPWSPSPDQAEDFTAIEEAAPSIDVAVLPATPNQPDLPLASVRPAEAKPAAIEVAATPRDVPTPPPAPDVAPTPAAPPATAAPAAQPAASEPISTDLAAETSPAETSPAPVTEPLAEPIPQPEPYADFPHFQGAQQTNCGIETCWTSPVEGGWRGAARSLQDSLEAQGYSLSNVTGEVLSTETGVRIYRVAKDGEDPYYLNLVSVADGLLYSLTPSPISEETLVALQGS